MNEFFVKEIVNILGVIMVVYVVFLYNVVCFQVMEGFENGVELWK